MKPNLKITQTGSKWQLQGTTVVKGMDDLEMLFRIEVMTYDEVCKLDEDLSYGELHNIVMQIRAHREKATQAEAGNIKKAAYALTGTELPAGDVTSYVVKEHSKRMGWIK